MSKFTYKIFLTLSSTSLLPVVYLIKEYRKWDCLAGVPAGIVCVLPLLFLSVPILFSALSLKVSPRLSSDSIEGGITDVEQANQAYLPSYLGYFFVALSISDWGTLFWVFVILFVFTFHSQTLYYNPIFLVFGYKFYYVTAGRGMKLFIITRKEISTTENLAFADLKRINDFTFIDGQRYE